MKGICSFLITLALIAGVVGCGRGGVEFYETLASNDKIEMMLINSPPTPPVNVSRAVVSVDHLTASAVILNDVPTSEWTYGCTATSAGMIFGYYDRTGYPDMYTGPTNGGVCPLTDLGQGIPTNPRYPISGSCYIIATENGKDGVNSSAHVDDYWISYGSAGPDPWEGNWPEHTWGLCTADFLGTNQWKWDYSSYPGTDGTKDTNTDGSTAIWNYNDGSKLYDWCPGPAYGLPTTSCCHGMRLFAESRGYSVDANYNQLTDNQNSNGFTFAEFQSEINAGRPVLIHVIGHTMVGMGYDAGTNSIYIHDTWDNNMHSMPWGGSYAGMDLYAVTVIHLTPPVEYDLTISSTAGGDVTTPGEGTYTYDEGTVVDLVATPGAGYRFDEWTGDVGTVADVNAASTNVTMNGDYSITANFVKTYDLTTSSTAGGDVTTPGEGTYTYDEGTVVDLVATPGAGYRFDEWTGDVGTVADVNAASTNVTMNGDYSITANFVKTYDLTTSSTAGGDVTTPGEGTYTYDEGTVVDLVAVPGASYCFDEWTGDVGTVADVNAASTNVTMNGDYSIIANFVAIHEFDLILKSGWNMISLPLESCTGETDPAVILPDAEAIYAWNCETTSWDSPSEIVPGKGYWVLVFEDVTETTYGTPIEEYQLSSDCEGWHMVGSLHVDGQVNVDSGSVYGSLYHWDPETLSYVARPLDDVRPGEGYWLLAFTDFSISIVPKPPSP